jgi:hypothetical protein
MFLYDTMDLFPPFFGLRCWRFHGMLVVYMGVYILFGNTQLYKQNVAKWMFWCSVPHNEGKPICVVFDYVFIYVILPLIPNFGRLAQLNLSFFFLFTCGTYKSSGLVLIIEFWYQRLFVDFWENKREVRS